MAQNPQQQAPDKLHEILKVNYQDKDHIALSNQSTLRRLVGISGMLLPVLLYIFLYIDINYAHPLPSISHYYYTRVCSIFVTTMTIIAVFLIIYKGSQPLDFYLSVIAGIFALSVVLFPTTNIYAPFAVTCLKVSKLRVTIHFVSAAIFLLSLAGMSFFVFTKSDKSVQERGRPKRIRNRIYRTSGALIVLSILVILIGNIDILPEGLQHFYNKYNLTFWMETVAVESFGISWLIKGKTLFKD